MKVSSDNGLIAKANLQADTKQKINPQAEKVAQEFEALFLDLMLKSMRRTATSEAESNAEGIYKSMLDTEYAKNMATNRSFGIKEIILDWMQKQHPQALTEKQSASSPSDPSAAREVELKTVLEKAEGLSLQEMQSKMALEIYKMQSKAGVK